MDKKYQIFLSSTYNDLKEERKAVQEAILSLYHFPIGMEMFSAADEEQWEIIKETIDSSDYYVLIIGHRYGSTLENDDGTIISYTEKEYEYAKEKGIPILVFIIDKSVRVSTENMEFDADKRIGLESFINKVKTKRTVEWWQDKNDLAAKVSIALTKQINRKKRPGWIRADTVDINGLQNELLELTKKVRLLEKENIELKNRVVDKKPELALLINDSKIINLQLFEASYDYLEADYMPITIDMVPVRNEDTQYEIEKYNESLPTKEELDKYKKECLKYDRITQHSTSIFFTVENNGNMKANDLHIEVEFPDEIKIFRKNMLKTIEAPQKPKTARNPLHSPLKGFQSIRDLYVANKPLSIWSEEMAQALQKECFLNENDNSISIRLSSLLHEYNYCIKDEFVIVPTEKGEFEIVCYFMCEEYEATSQSIIKVVVE